MADRQLIINETSAAAPVLNDLNGDGCVVNVVESLFSSPWLPVGSNSGPRYTSPGLRSPTQS